MWEERYLFIMTVNRFTFRGALYGDFEAFKKAVDQDFEAIAPRIKSHELLAVVVQKYKQNIFIYIETPGTDIDPMQLFPSASVMLCDWPGEADMRKWVRMYDIFHYCKDLEVDEWLRSDPDTCPGTFIIKIKPEKVVSYIFYHFQLQEEMEGDRSKYGSIYIDENLLVMYGERPDTRISPDYRGILNTKNSPPDWGNLMQEHFIPLEDVKNWFRIENIKYMYATK